MVWHKLAKENIASLAGIVVNSQASCDRLATETNVPVYRGLDRVSFDRIDAVDIVTPTATHFEIINRTLPHTHVLVEKPLAATSADATTLVQRASTTSNLLSVGHVYRFHPVIQALRKLTAEIPGLPGVIFGTMLNPADEAQPDAEPSMEMLHWFDVIDLLFGVAPSMCSALRNKNAVTVSLRYPHPAGAGQTNAVLRLGWDGTVRQRTLELIYRDRSLQADLSDQTITIDLGDSMRRIILPQGHSALEAELRGFAAAVRGRTDPDVDAATGARIVGIANQAIPRPPSRKPTVAVIGGGIFGATCAAELGEFCDVTLIERHDELLGEASTLNQWRYHHGFHYPRSIEMIREIQECRHEFEAVYGDAIVGDVASYTLRRVLHRSSRANVICTSVRAWGFLSSRNRHPQGCSICLRSISVCAPMKVCSMPTYCAASSRVA